jgi:hypothetical protein
MNKQVAIKDLLPNPFRNIEHYPIQREKIEALIESIGATTFWDNLVGRERNGKIEIAYGHHRLVALKEMYKLTHEIGINIRDFNDSDMLRSMARENMKEWGTSAIVEFETVRAVVEAYAAGKIELTQPDSGATKAHVRYAPSFSSGNERSHDSVHRYTAQTVSDFLGWTYKGGDPSRKVINALNGLQLIEDGLLTVEDFAGKNTSDAEAIIENARKQKKASEVIARELEQKAREEEKLAEKAESPQERQTAKKRAQSYQRDAERQRKMGRERASRVGKAISKEFSKNREDQKKLTDVVDDIVPLKDRPPKHIQIVFKELTRTISNFLYEDELAEKLAELLPFSEEINLDSRHFLIHELDRLIARIEATQTQWQKTFAITKKANADQRLLK